MFKNIIKPLTVIHSDTPRASEERPHDGSSCSIFLEVLSNFTECQESFTIPLNERSDIVLGDGASPCDFVIENCLMTMVSGGTCAITIDASEINPANEKKLPNIGTLGHVEFKLTLFHFDLTIPLLWKTAHSRLVERASRLKTEGVDLFNRNKITWAFWKFSKAIKLLVITNSCGNTDVELIEATKQLKLSLHLNVAACQLKRGHYEHVVDNCSKVLLVDEANVKAYFRRGTALTHLQEYERATADLKKVLSLEPGNKAAAKQMTVLKQKIQELNQSLSNALQQMFK